MRSFVAIVLFALLVCASAGTIRTQADKNRPVTKVINLLKDMITQLEKEDEEDEEVYETMGCWCTTNDKEKTKAIKNGEDRIEALSTEIEELTAKASMLNTEIANLNSEVAKNGEALDSATQLRTKQLAEFNAEEKDMLQSITSLKGAVIALSNHHDAALLQSQSETALELKAATVVATIEHGLKRYEDLFREVITPHQRKVIKAFAASPESFLGKKAALLQEGQPQSGEIFGILKQMKESFETNLAQSQKEESENSAAYEDLKIAKEKEIAAGQSQSDTKTNELAATEEKNAQAKGDLDDTRETLASDTEFLSMLKEKCQSIDQEYEARSKTRGLEIKATSKALAFLSSDEAHDLFTRTFNPALLQRTRSANRAEGLRQIAVALSAAGAKAKDPRVSMLAVSVKLNPAFGKVKKDIQKMVDALLLEKEDEIKKRDFCTEELNSNAKESESKLRDKNELLAKVEDLKMNIDGLIRDIENLKVAISEAQVQLERAGQDRETQNKDFQVTVADQKATQKLLTASLKILKGFYDKAALVQTKAHSSTGSSASPPPPPGFKAYENNASSGGVMGMMESIIADAKALEEEAIRGEEEAQKTYEEFVKSTTESVDTMTKEMDDKTGAKGKAETDLVQAERDLENTANAVEDLAAANRGLHLECDFVLKNFEARQATRDDEVDALKQSIAMFSGASFSAFAQGMN